MLWSIGSSPQVLKHCTFSHLLANFRRTNTQTKKKTLYFAHHRAVKGYKHNPFHVKSVRSESETSSHWTIVIRVMPGVEEDWVWFVTAHVGKRWRFTAGMEQSQREGGRDDTRQLHWHRCSCPQRGGGSPLFSMLPSATAASQLASLLSHVTQPLQKEQERVV